MNYDAITLDTSVFDRHQLNLQSGMLKQLFQFKDGIAQFVLSEIVVREIHKHLTLRAQRAKENLEAAIKATSESSLIDQQSVATLKTIEKSLKSPKVAARAQIEDFLVNTGAEIVPADKGDMKRLIAMYFGTDAPFEDSKDKKNEFPDAIALMTLEDWAKAKNKKVLAISTDKGWEEFAKTSDWIDFDNDLAAALERLQRDAEKARQLVRSALQRIQTGDLPEELEFITNAVALQVSGLSPYIDASAAYYYDFEVTEMSFQAMRFLHEDEDDDFYVVQMGKDKIVARVAVAISAKAKAEFTFQTKDEGDYVPVGGSVAEADVEFNAGVLLTFEGDFGQVPPEHEITDVELVDELKSIDFGDVDIDWDDHGYDD